MGRGEGCELSAIPLQSGSLRCGEPRRRVLGGSGAWRGEQGSSLEKGRVPNRVGAWEVGSTHLGPEDTTVQSAGGLVVEKVELQRAQGSWTREKSQCETSCEVV